MRELYLIFFLCLTKALWAQPSPGERDAAKQDPADEIGKIKKNCFDHPLGCGEVLFTGQPIHIAVGSIAPQNGFGAGVAYVGHKTTDNWRDNWTADAIASGNGSWRAGMYAKFVDSRQSTPLVQRGLPKNPDLPTELPEQPVINVYVQATSLNKLTFFGLGPGTTRSQRAFYGMTETIAGASYVKPFNTSLHFALYGEGNGRWTEIRPSAGQESPSIEQLYTNATAPGLANSTSYFQLGAGARMRPSFVNDVFHLNYDVSYRPYIAAGTSHMSFQRLTADLSHQMSIFRKMYSAYNQKHNLTLAPTPERLNNGPNDCSTDSGADHPVCPEAGAARALEGSIGVRLFAALSMTPNGSTVPFYFQPTLGGSDINGTPTLASFEDYRFRAPNLMLIRESFEHSVWKWPVGFTLAADQGTLAMTRGDLGTEWRHSFSAGLTFHAGGLPVLSLLFSWGGGEGTHTAATVNTTLLGGSARPYLY